MGISPDPVEDNRELAAQLELSFPLLSDPEMELTDRYGVRHTQASARRGDLPFPTTFIVDSDGLLRYKSANESHRERPTAADVVEAVRSGVSGPVAGS